MTVTDEIYDLAMRLSAEDVDAALLRSLCAVSEKHFRAQLRTDLAEAEYRESLVCAAAFLAVSYLPAGKTGAQAVKAFTVGDVSVTAAEGESLAADAAALRAQAQALMAPYSARGGGFAFLGVRG